MSLSPVCIRQLCLSRGIPNFCACPKCRDTKEHKEAVDYYRRNLPGNEIFPDKTGRIEDERE